MSFLFLRNLFYLILLSSISAVNSSRVFSLGFVMAGRSFLLVGMEKGQSIFSAALVGEIKLFFCV